MMVDWRVKDFKPKHLKHIRVRTHDQGEMISSWKEIAKKSIAYSFFNEKGRFVFCGGILIHHPGFGEGWVLCSEEVKYYPITVFKFTKMYLNRIIKDNNLYRVQVTTRSNWPQAQRFVRMLGFTPEGILRKYGPDKSDYKMYARIE